MATVADTVDSLARRALAILWAMLPERLWPRLERYVPVSSSALPAAILTLAAAAAIGISGFLRFAAEQASANNDLMLKAAVRPEGHAVTTAMPVALTAFSLFTFLLMTPTGWLTMYLGLSGLVRAVGAAVHDPRGDFLLSMADAAAVRLAERARAFVRHRHRSWLEGPEVPDRIVPGSQLGMSAADLVIIASRRKRGWDAGTVVITAAAMYRVGRILERTMDGRLRTLYPLTEHNDLEVFRRTVHYEMPEAARRMV